MNDHPKPSAPVVVEFDAPKATFEEKLRDLMRQPMAPSTFARSIRMLVRHEQLSRADAEPWRREELVEDFWVCVRDTRAEVMNADALRRLCDSKILGPESRLLVAEQILVADGWIVQRPDTTFVQPNAWYLDDAAYLV